MHQRAVIEKEPERVLLQRAEIADHGDENAGHALLVQGTREMVMIGDVMMFVGSRTTGTICLPRNAAPPCGSRFLHSFCLALTSRIPTVICVGRSSAIGTGFRRGSRAIGMFTSPRLCFARMGGARQP